MTILIHSVLLDGKIILNDFIFYIEKQIFCNLGWWDFRYDIIKIGVFIDLFSYLNWKKKNLTFDTSLSDVNLYIANRGKFSL